MFMTSFTDECYIITILHVIMLIIIQHIFGICKGENMKSFFLENFKGKDQYWLFLCIMMVHSDAFSLVYFRYNENEKLKRTARKIKDALKPYKIYAENVTEWPSMITLNEMGHIYRLEMYRSDMGTEEILYTSNGIYNWDYPKFPMDLCFYKDGYAIFASCAHERINTLYTDDEVLLALLQDIGLELVEEDNVPKSNIFYEKRADWKNNV